MRIDNNTLAVVLVVAIVLSVGVLFYNSGFFGISGALTSDTGTANFSIESAVSIKFTDKIAYLGNGSVNTTTLARIDSEGNKTNWSGTGPTHDFLVLENDGNSIANITVTSTAPASFIGGSSTYGPPNLYIRPNQTEGGSCITWGSSIGAANLQFNNYTALSTTALVACHRLNFTDINDAIEFNFRMDIPSDATPGQKASTITASGSLAAAL